MYTCAPVNCSCSYMEASYHNPVGTVVFMINHLLHHLRSGERSQGGGQGIHIHFSWKTTQPEVGQYDLISLSY